MGWAERVGLGRYCRAGEDGWARLSARRIYILPTRYGWLLGLLLFVMLVGSINYANNMGFLLTFLLAGVSVASIFYTFGTLLGLECRLLPPEEVYAGESPIFSLQLRQQRARAPLEISADYLPSVRAIPGAGPEERVRLGLAPVVRGVFRPGGLRLATEVPLGLFRAWALLEFPLEVVVYPTPTPWRQSLPQQGVGGEAEAVAGEEGDDFVGLRDWRPGDPPRRIHWRRVARGDGDLVTKLFGRSRGQDVWLDWAELEGLNREQRLSQLCRWVLDAAREGHNFGLRLPDREIGPGSDGAHRRRCLYALGRFPE